MPAPYSWLTVPAVNAALSQPEDAELSPAAELARAAAGAFVERNRPDLVWVDPITLEGVGVVGADVLQGAALLTARLHARRSSPLGLASFGEFGPSAVLRLDPDVERLLGLGRYGRPRVG